MSKLTVDEVAAALRTALEAGSQAGNSRVQELKQEATKNNGQPVLEECGNAMVLIKLDGRSQLARVIKKSTDAGISISRMSSTVHRGFYGVHASLEIQGDAQVSFQNGSIHEYAAEAMAESLEKQLGVKTTVYSWRN